MNKIVLYGPEWIYQQIVLMLDDYNDFKSLKSSSKDWYQALDDPFFRQEDKSKFYETEHGYHTNPFFRTQSHLFFRNCLRQEIIMPDFGFFTITYNGDIKHGPFRLHMTHRFEYDDYIGATPANKKKLWIRDKPYLELGAYINDLLEGPVMTYNGNDVLMKKANYVKGKLHGEVRKYFKDGKVKSIKYYRNGFRLKGLVMKYM